MPRVFIYLICFCLGTAHSILANSELDSLKAVVNSMPEDSLKCEHLLRIAYLLYSGETSVQYAQKALVLAKKLDKLQLTAHAYHRLAWCHGYDEMEKKTAFLDSAQLVFSQLNDLNGLGKVFDTKGAFFMNYGSLEDAQIAFQKGYDYYDAVNNEERKAGILNNWSIALYESGKPEAAREKYLTALKYRLKEQPENPKEIARLYFGLGECARLLGELEQATDHQIASFRYRQKINNIAIAENLICIADMTFEAATKDQDTSGIYQRIRTWGFPSTIALLDSAASVPGISELSAFQLSIKEVRRKWYWLNGSFEMAYQLLEEIKAAEEEEKLSESSLEAIANLKVKYERERLKSELLEEEIVNRKKATQVNLLFLSLGILLSTSVIIFLIYQNRLKANRLLLNAAKQDQQLIAINAMLEGQERERARIARDLHDGLGNMLSTIKASVSVLNQNFAQNTKLPLYVKASEMIDEACTEVRKIAHEMMPRSLEKLGLIQALEDMVQQMDEAYPFAVSIDIYGVEQSFDDSTNVMLYRIVQELLNNVVKYAQASKVVLQLTFSEEWLNIIVEDDGIGFEPENLSPNQGMGLNSIAFRIQYIGGEYEIDSRLGMGTMVSINVPLNQAV